MSGTRRDFLKAAFGASTLLSFAPGAPSFLVRSAAFAGRRRDERDTVLVVVQLTGGNDGLNTVVPYADDEYARNRPTLRLPVKDLHKIAEILGRRGYAADDIELVMYGNWVRFLRQSWA